MTEHAPWKPYKPAPFSRLLGLRVRLRDELWLRRVARAVDKPLAAYLAEMKMAEATALDHLESVRDAHDWGCDCTPDDPCRILIALNGGPSRPEFDS